MLSAITTSPSPHHHRHIARYLSVRAALDRAKPTKLVVHLLGGVEPYGEWWAAAKADATAAGVLELRPFARSELPATVNGHTLALPAHVGDFKRFAVLYEEGGIYLDTDHILIRDVGPLLRGGGSGGGASSVWGRQAENEHGHQIAIGCMMTVPRNPILADMQARMRRVFDGGWTTHSIDMVDAYFKEHGAGAGDDAGGDAGAGAAGGTQQQQQQQQQQQKKQLPRGTVVLPYPQLFPFGWQRELIYGTAQSLFNGQGFSFDAPRPVYSIHLFHSQSEGVTRYIGGSELRPEATNFARAVAMAVDEPAKLFAKLGELQYFSGEVKAKLRALAKKNGVKEDGTPLLL